MDIYDIIRRWHNGQKLAHISHVLGYDRKTLRKYIEHAKSKGINQDQPLPPKEEVIKLLQDITTDDVQRPSRAQDIIEPYKQEIIDLINDKSIPLRPKIAFEVICERHNLEGKVSYSSFKRFVKANSLVITPQKLTCRIEVPPGSEVQVDYGKMGLLLDPLTGKRRSVYAFIGTLSHSRHQYVEFVYKQNQKSFVASHVKMFEYFGGVPERIVLDNLKSGVIKPSLYNPVLNNAYREMAEHYNCFLDPCRVGHPKDKGKVESQVKTVRQQFRKQLAHNSTLDIHQANQQIKGWCLGKHGNRIHGTTQLQPYPTFLNIEKSTLGPLPQDTFEVPEWKEARVHSDHYVQFNKKAFSVPHAYVTKKVWVKGTHNLVQIFYQNKLVKQHVIKNCYRHTDWNDFPENIRAALDEGMPRYLQQQARNIGCHFEQLVRNILEPHAFINLRKVQGLLSLANKLDHALVEKAAAVALKQHISVTPKNFMRLIEYLKQQDQHDEQMPVSEATNDFVRSMNYFIQN